MITKEENAKRNGLYSLGYSDNRIAVISGVTRHSIFSWRKIRHISPNHKRGRPLKIKKGV